MRLRLAAAAFEPVCLRDEAAFLIAPLSRSLALVGRNDSTPWEVTPSHVNALLAAWSLDWIAGPTADVVADALRDRPGVVKSNAN